MFLQISWRCLTFAWFNEYFEWVDRYMNLLPLRTKVYSICICYRRKGKNMLMFVWLIGKISHFLNGMGHQVHHLKSLIFLLYTNSVQCELVSVETTLLSFMQLFLFYGLTLILDFNFYSMEIRNFWAMHFALND